MGYAFDAGSGNKELSDVFSALYVAGCAAAVLAVRQPGIFTAVVQPPLILFCAVPAAYWLFHGAKLKGLKGLLINCGYPLIERFPLMLFTSAGVLLIGMIRWYRALSARSTATGRTAAAGSRRRADGRAAKSARTTGGRGRPAKRPAPVRSRRRPPPNEIGEPPVEPRRRRSTTRIRDVDAAEPRRRPRVGNEPDPRPRPPREIRRDPHVRRGRATARNRFDYERDAERDAYEPFQPPGPRRRPAPRGTGAAATHHPISRVRYRESAETGESRPAARTRRFEAESWEYDI
jgi:hypothetical protein